MNKFDKILADIKSVKIQGAENIAKAGIKAYLISPSKESAKKIISVRPTEPLLQNCIKLLLKSNKPKIMAKKILKSIEKAHKSMALEGSKLIKDDMNVYTHCHSSSVIDLLKFAKKRGKKFVVYTTEVEPLLQGRKMAEDMARAGIKVVLAPDLAADKLMSQCDLFLFGADAFTNNFVVNKLGTSTLCDLAIHHKIPRYSCGILMKYAKIIELEKRPSFEVWRKKNNNIDIENPAFDKISYDLISGIVCEKGILSCKKFKDLAKINFNEHS